MMTKVHVYKKCYTKRYVEVYSETNDKCDAETQAHDYAKEAVRLYSKDEDITRFFK